MMPDMSQHEKPSKHLFARFFMYSEGYLAVLMFINSQKCPPKARSVYKKMREFNCVYESIKSVYQIV
jgi:hypothetical protein